MKKLMFCLICMCAAVFAQQPGENKVRMAIPGVKGILELNVGPTTSEMRVRDDGLETQMRAMERPDHLDISAFIQKVDFAASADICRNQWWESTYKGYKSHKIKVDHLAQSSRENMALVEYIVPEFEGRPLKQKGTHVYLGARDLCAEVHLSKVQFTAEDQKLFDDVVSSIKLLPDEQSEAPQAGQTSMYYLGLGSRFYLDKDYGRAIIAYQKAVDMEKQKRTLDQTRFRVLVDNLGIAYGITGDIPKSMETLQYGLTQDPEYPMFHYNIACGYGEMGQMDEALKELQLTYKYKANSIPGESVPDPLNDSSFKKWKKEKKFVDAVNQMQGE